MPDLPKGFTCSKCGKTHEFATYVYAHWDALLTHTCDCGQVHEIIRGRAFPKRARKKRDKK